MLTRRTFLQLTGTAILAPPALTHAAQADRTRIRRLLPLAIFTGVYAGLPLEQALTRIRDEGFRGIVMEGVFADVRFDPWAPDWDVAGKIMGAVKRHELKVVGLYGYYNLVHPDPAKRKVGEARLQLLIENWRRFDCPVISTETGTFNAQSEWVEAPENATEAGYLECRAALKRWVQLAERTGAIIAIETYWRNIIDSVDRAERLFREVNSPALKLTMDPCNFYRKEDLVNMQPMLKDMFARLGKQTVIAHAKDVKASAEGTDLPAAGKGVLDYPLYLRLLAQLDREIYLAVEHLTLEDVPRARDYVLSQIDRIV
jgi:sugar phosphate isomerase/epimerase